MRAFFIFLNDDEGIFKGQYPHDFSRGFAASLSLCKWNWDSMLVYLSGDLCSIILCHFGFLGIWLGSSQSNGVAEANWLIPYLRSPCTFSALIFYCILGSLLQGWINSSYVSRRNITCFLWHAMELLRGAGHRNQLSIEFHGSESMMQLTNPFSFTPVQNVTGKCIYELYNFRNCKDICKF